jgi:hypothetical protein
VRKLHGCARDIAESELAADTRRSTLEEHAQWTASAEKILVF